jgi:hypothetical protein
MLRTQTLVKCNWGVFYDKECSEHNMFCEHVRLYGRVVCAKQIKVEWKM